MSLYEAVGDVLTSRFEVKPEDLRPEASFDELDLDSLAQVEFAEILAERFGVPFNEDELQELHTVADVVKWLENKGATVS